LTLAYTFGHLILVQTSFFFDHLACSGRKRMRFESGSGAQKYMQGSKYARKFYIKYTDDNGKSMVRSIK